MRFPRSLWACRSASASARQESYYRVLAPQRGALTAAIDFAELPGAEVMLGRIAERRVVRRPDTGSLLASAALADQSGRDEYYVRLRGREDASGSVAFTITVTSSEFEITRASATWDLRRLCECEARNSPRIRPCACVGRGAWCARRGPSGLFAKTAS